MSVRLPPGFRNQALSGTPRRDRFFRNERNHVTQGNRPEYVCPSAVGGRSVRAMGGRGPKNLRPEQFVRTEIDFKNRLFVEK